MGELKQRCRRRASQAENNFQVDATTRDGQLRAQCTSRVILPFLANTEFSSIEHDLPS